jgi:uncharacterized repeat protein (TIGR04052 family)
MKRNLLLLATAALLTACRADAPAPAPAAAPVETAAAAVVSGTPLTLNIEAHVAGQPLDCTTSYPAGDTTWRLSELMLYLHDFALVSDDGTVTPLVLPDVSDWQAHGVVLIDLAGTDNGCTEATPERNTSIALQVPEGATGQRLRFRFGVPFAVNHADPTTLQGPLSRMTMHWGWRGGYKFIRLEGAAANEADVMLHLGSTGCTGPMTAVEQCDHGGQVEFFVDFERARTEGLRLDLAPMLDATLIAGTRCMGTDAAGKANCSTGWRALEARTGAAGEYSAAWTTP